MNSLHTFASIYLYISALNLIKCENILIMHPFIGGSHVLNLRRVAEALTEQNHQVTIIRWLDSKWYNEISNPNISELVLSLNNSDSSIPMVTHEEHGRYVAQEKRMWTKGFKFSLFPILDGAKLIFAYCQKLLGNEILFNQLESQHFKVAIVDLVFNDCSLALAHTLGVPAIGFWGISSPSGYGPSSTSFNPPSYVPELFSSLKDKMTYTERVRNTIVMIIFEIYTQLQYAVSNYAIRKVMPNAPYPSELIGNLSGVLINSMPGFDYPRLLPPSFVEVGGMHISPKKNLPEDILEFIESSGSEGFILFSLGTSPNSYFMPNETSRAYFEVFGKLKQKVIVKGTGYPQFVPDNVRIYPYLPQADILGHPKIVLFISHSGIHGIYEAIFAEVPIVGIPICLDQRDNIVKLTELGVAKGLAKDSSAEQIYETINIVLKDPSYKENLAKLSNRIKRFGDPLQKALWLVNHVIYTDGAEHLKLASRHLSLFQFLCLDVFAFLITLMTILSYAIYKITSKLTSGLNKSLTRKLKMS